ncbi:Calpain-like cysteine protease c2 [Globisporangium polare]
MRQETQTLLIPTTTHVSIKRRRPRHRHAFLLAVVCLCALFLNVVQTQTTNDLGFPDPRYSTSKTLTKFSCTGGPKNCPDGGEYAAAGGNLTLTILEMRNLPNLDGFGLAGLLTDAYIEVSIGDSVRRSSVIENSLNPKWLPCSAPGCSGPNDFKRDLNFGFRPAGTEITIRALDEDSGLEFGDDLIAEITLNAIYCSAFSAIAQTTVSADDSSWKMRKQPLCVEEVWIPLVADSTEGCVLNATTGTTISTVTPCMRLRMTAQPFQMRTEQVFVANAVVSGGMGGYFPNEDSWLYGRVYSASDTRMLSYFRMDKSKGGLLIRSDSTNNNNKGNASLIATYGYAPYARVTINFDAEVFVFRRVDDAASTPEWLNTSFGWTSTREYAQLMDVAGDFKAVAQNFSAHSINSYGDAFRNGIITGANLNQAYKDTTLSMYFILAAPHESFDVVAAVYSKEFSRQKFIEIGLQFFPNFLFIVALVLRYLKRMNWRVERVQSFLVEKVVDNSKPGLAVALSASGSASGKPKKNPGTSAPTVEAKKLGGNSSSEPDKKPGKPDIVALLFLCYNESPDNVDFRRNLFYATCTIYLTMLMPLLFLVSWGVTAILLITPPAFGFGLIFLGIGALATSYALIRWIRLGWRMTDTILRLFSVTFGFAFVFLFSATFADPKVFVGGEPLEFFSLTAIFLTLNMMPMIWIAFTNDAKITKSLSQIVSAVGAAKKVNALKTKFKNLGTLGLKLATAKGQAASQDQDSASGQQSLKRSRKQSVFAPLMGDHYSVEQSIPGFNRADILNNAFITPAETRRQKNRKYYSYAVGILVVYCIVAGVRSSYPTQAIGIAITVLLVDVCILLLSRGFLSWSAGYIVFLMSSVRVCLAATCGEYWILGHAFLYMVFGTALCIEIIGKNLPRMNKQEAGGVTFFGHDHMQWRHFDISTTPEFVLGFLSFFYIFLLLAVAFGTDANNMIRVPVAGQQWPLWIFGVLAFIVVLFIGLSLATSRAFFLQKEQLLSEYAMKVYLFVHAVRLPFMLAAASEVLVICSGLFVYASTRSTFILVTSIFGPLILMLSLAVYAQWRKNDYRLVIWPPEDDEEDILDDDDAFDEEDALEKEAEIMRETFVLPPLKGKGNTSIFDGNDETFKMPALPPKNLLQQTKFGSKAGAGAAAGGPGKLGGPGQSASPFGKGTLNARKLGALKEAQGDGVKTDASVSPQGSASDGLAIVVATETGQETPGSPLTRRRKRRFGFLRDLCARRVSLRALFSKQAWRKYKEVEHQSASSAGSPRGTNNGTQPLLGSKRRSSATSTGANANRDPDVDFSKMSLYDAYQQGFLLPHDYATLGCFGALLGLLLLYGIIISFTEKPMWLGHLIWVAGYVLLFSLFPTIKYFKIAAVEKDLKFAFAASYLLAWITGFILFFAVMKANVNEIESLVILSLLVFYPIFLLFIVTLLKWKDENWELSRPIKRIFAFCLVAITLWIFEMYIFADVVLGAVLTFLLALFLFITYFLVKWVENDMYLAPIYQKRANVIILASTCLAIGIGLLSGLNFFYCLSIVFVVLILKYTAHFVASWFVAKEEVSVFYSPYLFPVFSYNAYTNNVVDENASIKYLYVIFTLAFFWGVSGVMFFDPLGFGVGLCSLVLLVFAGITAHLCAVTPVKMGIASKYVNEMILKDASAAAKLVAEKRRKPFMLESTEFIELEKRERKAELEFQAIAYGGGAFAKKKPNPFGKSNGGSDKQPAKVDEDEANSTVSPEERRSGGEVAMEIDALERSCRVRMVDGQEQPLCDGLLTWKDVSHEVFHLASGPFGFLYFFTLPWRLIKFLKWKYLPAKWSRSSVQQQQQQQQPGEGETDGQDLLDSVEKGNKLRHKKKEPTDLVGILMELPVLDEELDREFFEETRCIIHFQLLMLNAADARLSREKILFQKFLRENRFKLMSNGINPPANIFKTSSFASIDIPLVAVWLISLTPEERARFHALKAAFNEEMERVDAIVDAEDSQSRMAQNELREYWREHEEAQCRRRMQEFQARRMRREAEGILTEELAGQDEATLNAQEAIMEIESGYSCVPGEFGRALQYVDREFPPDQTSLATCTSENEVTGWKVSTAINVVAGLFDGGTDPDDVIVGKLNDSWLLSAISIIAASGGVDDGKVDALIDKMFVTKQTSLTGAYAMRIFKNCQWETVIVDDYFPVLADSFKATPCAGAAFAHSKDFEELWVPLLEKAFAKYYGGYASLERGYVHHALKDLTGYDSEEVFLAQASRGSLKRTLWKQLLIYKANKFLMGAGTITSENADTEILDTGLVFGACYVIYDVREIDGYQLLMLRNPPGDHDEWKGDWSDHSHLWTRRLKKLLKWNPDNDDNTFWMNFDDFCHAFRSLYICRYYDPAKWPVQVLDGAWLGDTACGLPTRHNPDCILEGNPQYALAVPRPTEIMVTVTQVDPKGLAPVTVLPFAVYIVAQGNHKDRASRVKHLTRENVVAHSGEPMRQREVQIHCELEARTYTVLVVAYKKAMEGPFKLKVQSNYPVVLEQLWPAVWKDPSKTTMAEKMAAKMKETVAESSAMAKIREKKNELVSKIAAGAAVMDNVLRDDETILKAELEKQQHKEAEAAVASSSATAGAKKKSDKPKHVWIEQWDDNAGKPFYFNKQTGLSSWEKPADF